MESPWLPLEYLSLGIRFITSSNLCVAIIVLPFNKEHLTDEDQVDPYLI